MTGGRVERARGERGTALVTALVLLFAFTAAGVIWLGRDVNRRVTNHTAAQSIAFQAARAGAQQVAVASLRDGGSSSVVLDDARAREQAHRAAGELFDSYSVDGRVVAVDVTVDEITVIVEIADPVGDVRGTASARAERGP